jgi:hypothetical protein
VCMTWRQVDSIAPAQSLLRLSPVLGWAGHAQGASRRTTRRAFSS